MLLVCFTISLADSHLSQSVDRGRVRCFYVADTKNTFALAPDSVEMQCRNGRWGNKKPDSCNRSAQHRPSLQIVRTSETSTGHLDAGVGNTTVLGARRRVDVVFLKKENPFSFPRKATSTRLRTANGCIICYICIHLGRRCSVGHL